MRSHVLYCLVTITALASVAAIASDKGAVLDPAQAGLAVYPGAKADAATNTFVRDSLGLAASVYRTGDSVAQVAGFYARQPGTSQLPGASGEQAGFSAGCKDEYDRFMKRNLRKCAFRVTIQNPWMDMRTGQLVKDTLITIARD